MTRYSSSEAEAAARAAVNARSSFAANVIHFSNSITDSSDNSWGDGPSKFLLCPIAALLSCFHYIAKKSCTRTTSLFTFCLSQVKTLRKCQVSSTTLRLRASTSQANSPHDTSEEPIKATGAEQTSHPSTDPAAQSAAVFDCRRRYFRRPRVTNIVGEAVRRPPARSQGRGRAKGVKCPINRRRLNLTSHSHTLSLATTTT